MPVILAIKRLWQKDCTFESSLGYIASSRPEWAATARKCLTEGGGIKWKEGGKKE